MLSVILAAALAVLPEGRGAMLSAPVNVVTEPAGAVVTATWRDHAGEVREASCVAPCTLHVAKMAPAHFDVTLAGYVAHLPPMRWKQVGITYRLDPDRLRIVLTPEAR